MVSITAILGVVTTSSFAMLGGDEAEKADESHRVAPSRDNFLGTFPEGTSLPDAWKDKVVTRAGTLAAGRPDASLRDLYEAAYTAEITGQLSYVFAYHYSHSRLQYVQLPVEHRPTLYARAMKIMQKSDTELASDTHPLSLAFGERDAATLTIQKTVRGWSARKAYTILKAREEADRQRRIAAEADRMRAEQEEADRKAEAEARAQRLLDAAAAAYRESVEKAQRALDTKGSGFRVAVKSGNIVDNENKVIIWKRDITSTPAEELVKRGLVR